MPKGLKETSGLITIGFSQTESAANTFTQDTVDLQLNVLDREVFVVYGIALDISSPNFAAGTDTAVFASVSTTSRTSVGNLGDSNVLATGANELVAGAAEAAPFQYASNDTSPTQLEYMGIIATNDFFVQVVGSNNASAKTVSGKLYGVRAQASADVFAALTQSELLSA